VHGLGLDPAIGKGLCAEIGRDIYFERLADSKADGIISADERSRLNRIRQTFGLTVDVPPQGMDYTQAVATAMQRASILFEEVRRSVSSLTGAYAAAVTANPVIGNHPQCVTVASQLQRWHDTIGECKRIAASATSDADGYSLVINAEVKASAVRCEIQMSLVPQEVETFATWRRKTVKQVEKARADAIKSAEHERQIASRRVAEAAGFEITRGSAASRAWAYCIIVEQCLVTAEWQALADAGTDHADASLKEWLLHRPATFWTDDFAGAGFTAARAAFAESSTRGRKRPAKANVTTDFDLSIG
jgi:hypothetical protein